MEEVRQFAFVDESGDSGLSLDKTGTSSHFIIAAVIVEQARLTEARSQLDAIRAKHFQKGEMKSSKIASEDDRRIRILQDIREVPFHLVAFITDKGRLMKSSGLRYHDSFVKFLSMHIYNELYASYSRLKVTADEHKNDVFMDSFCHYLTSRIKPNLFDDYCFEFGRSCDDVLLQLADFMAGTVAKGFESRRQSPRFDEFVRLLGSKVLRFKRWPGDYTDHLERLHKEAGVQYNPEIAACSARLANLYIKQNESNNDIDVSLQVNLLEYLLHKLRFDQPNRYVSAQEIRHHLRIPSAHYLRSRVVAPLRDRGVLISSSASGYKIPISEKEIRDFVEFGMTMIEPMVYRLKKCREQIQVATKNDLDVIDGEKNAAWRKLLDELA